MRKLFLISLFLVGALSKDAHFARIFGDLAQYAYYYIDLQVGSPYPQIVSTILDTGSSVVAFPCNICKKCGTHMDKYYDFDKSETAQWKSCDGVCNCKEGKCSYAQRYTEGSSISGFWFYDEVSFGDVGCGNPAFEAQLGCHTEETKLFSNQKAAGIMGVSPSKNGQKSIIDYIYDSKQIDKDMFSICLSSKGGMLSIGGINKGYHLTENSLQWTEYSKGSFYYVSIEQLSTSSGPLLANFGQTIVDSGTTYTYLTPNAWKVVFNLINNAYTLSTVGIDHCFQSNNVEESNKVLELFPTFKFTFKNNAALSWRPNNYFFLRRKLSTNTLEYCLAIADNGINETVLGSSFMIGHDFVFDRENFKIGIAEANCPVFETRDAYPPDNYKRGDYVEGSQCLINYKSFRDQTSNIIDSSTNTNIQNNQNNNQNNPQNTQANDNGNANQYVTINNGNSNNVNTVAEETTSIINHTTNKSTIESKSNAEKKALLIIFVCASFSVVLAMFWIIAKTWNVSRSIVTISDTNRNNNHQPIATSEIDYQCKEDSSNVLEIIDSSRL